MLYLLGIPKNFIFQCNVLCHNTRFLFWKRLIRASWKVELLKSYQIIFRLNKCGIFHESSSKPIQFKLRTESKNTIDSMSKKDLGELNTTVAET